VVDGPAWTKVLQGSDAVLFKHDMSRLSNHLCGIQKDAEVEGWITSVPADTHDRHVYNYVIEVHCLNRKD